MDKLMETISGHVERIGWAVQGVGSGLVDPSFVYTIGLWRNYQHPEIIITGVPLGLGAGILNVVGEQVGMGVRFGCEENYPGILENYRVAFRPIEDPSVGHWFNVASCYYRGYSFKVLQMFFPDAAGRFPFDEGYDYVDQPVPYDNV